MKTADSGKINVGETLFMVISHKGIQLKEKGISLFFKDIAEVIVMANGTTASQIGNSFMFPPKTQHAFVVVEEKKRTQVY